MNCGRVIMSLQFSKDIEKEKKGFLKKEEVFEPEISKFEVRWERNY